MKSENVLLFKEKEYFNLFPSAFKFFVENPGYKSIQNL